MLFWLAFVRWGKHLVQDQGLGGGGAVLPQCGHSHETWQHRTACIFDTSFMFQASGVILEILFSYLCNLQEGIQSLASSLDLILLDLSLL